MLRSRHDVRVNGTMATTAIQLLLRFAGSISIDHRKREYGSTQVVAGTAGRLEVRSRIA